MKFIDNVLIPAHDRLAEEGKAVVELEDVRDTGFVVKHRFSSTELADRKIPARVTLYDWDKIKVFPLPTRAVVFDESNPVSYPLPQEVKAFNDDLILMYEELMEDAAKEFGADKKGSPFHSDYEANRFWKDVRKNITPQFWERMWKMMMEVAGAGF